MPLFDAWPGEKLAIKIVEVAERAGVGLLRPFQLRREGVAKAEVERLQRLALAQAEKDAADLVADKVRYDPTSGRLLPAPPPANPAVEALVGSSRPMEDDTDVPGSPRLRLGSAYSVASAASRGFVLRETQRVINLERIIQTAQAEAGSVNDAAVSDEPVHPDWFSRWRDGAQDVSDEEVQRLWARALAGEAQKPGSYSLRTLDFLRSVSKRDAELIEKIGPLAIGSFIYKNEALLKQRDLPYAKLALLQHLGIVAGVEALGLTWQLPRESAERASSFAFRCCELGIVCQEATTTVAIPIYSITPLGSEVLHLGRFKADREYVNAFATFVAGLGAKCLVGVAIDLFDNQVVLMTPVQQFDPPAAAAASP